MNHSKDAPTKGKFEIYSPSQLHSQLEELRHLANCVYFTLHGAGGNAICIESGTYVACLVASKLDDLAFHYESILEDEKSGTEKAYELFKQLTPERQREALAAMRGMLGGEQ